MSVAEHLQPILRARFIDRMLASPRGRTFFLTQAARAEDSDEGRFFAELERKVDDAELRSMIRIHKGDEQRHAARFAAAAAATGMTIAIPASLDLLPRLDAALGGVLDSLVDDRVSVMEAYLLLQVLEERAVTQFELMQPSARRHAPALADLLGEIARDERRHLKYCRAIARRYAPDAATLDATLARYREVEARIFVAHGRDVTRFVLDHDLMAATPLERLAWRAVLAALARRPAEMDRTPFWGQPAVA